MAARLRAQGKAVAAVRTESQARAGLVAWPAPAELGRVRIRGGLRDFEAAFGMNDDANAGSLAAKAFAPVRR